MNNVTLKQLRYFVAVSETKHFGKAANRCAITQPALSMQIKELEQQVGAPLFERTARQITLTKFGGEFLSRTQKILQSVDELNELARSNSELMLGDIRIGIIPTIAPYLLPSIVRKLTENYPDIETQIREAQTHHLVDELRSGTLDFAILALPLDESGLNEIPLFEEEFVLVRPKSEELLPTPSPSSLRAMKLLLLEEGHCFRDQALSFCQIKNETARDVMDGSTLSTLVQMVGSGIGVTLIPEMAIDIETRSADVAICRFTDRKPSRTVGMVFRQSNPLASRFEEIAHLLKR